ncbi:MAG: hypothetical protein PGN13_04430 [Patulibacter minatonensis]
MQWSKKQQRAAADEASAAPALPRAPNAWRATSRAERRWIQAPIASVRTRCSVWNLVPGIGLLRDGKHLWGFTALATALPTISLAFQTGRTMYTAIWVGLVGASSQAMAMGRIGSASGAFLERVASWQARRRNRRPDCPRCGLHNAAPAGLCGACEAALAAGLVAPTAAVRAADGFSFPADPALGDFVSPHLLVHTTLGQSVRRSHDKLRALAKGVEQRVTDLRHDFLSAHVEPLDPAVLWVRVQESATLADGTPFVELVVRRVRWDEGRVIEVWSTARTWFPQGTPSARAGRSPVSMPGAVGGRIGF